MATRPSSPRRVLRPPPQPGMQTLDRSAFTLRFPVLAARVPAVHAGGLQKDKKVQEAVLGVPRFKVLLRDPNEGEGRLLLLDVDREEDIPEEARAALAEKANGFVQQDVEIGYDYWSATDILRAVLPAELADEAPSSFTLTGHIAHLNLRDEFLPYKHLIGQVLLDKNRVLRTVVNKLDTIDSEFRVFKMEVIAGEDDLVATVSEAGCKFTFDFSTVYWNSRLASEHERLVELFAPGEVVADVMAGVGPFAVPAARKGCFVLGNDLNPESARWMERNRVDNRVQPTLRVSNIDGREFIRTAALQAWTQPFPPVPAPPSEMKRLAKEARRAREAAKKGGVEPEGSKQSEAAAAPPPGKPSASQAPSATQPDPQHISHFVMNLPGSALEFLDAYGGCYNPLLGVEGFVGKATIPMPLVHTHCFTKEVEGEAAEQDICQRATGYLDHPVTPSMDGYNLHMVRSVAPNKDMYCLTFRLPREVAFR